MTLFLFPRLHVFCDIKVKEALVFVTLSQRVGSSSINLASVSEIPQITQRLSVYETILQSIRVPVLTILNAVNHRSTSGSLLAALMGLDTTSPTAAQVSLKSTF